MHAIVYRTDDLSQWGFGQGSDLTAAQVDNNFWNLNVRVTTLEGAHAFKQIHFIYESNGNLFVVYTDGSQDGPFPLPTAAFAWAGIWQPNTPYSIYNLIYYAGGIYAAVTNFTSGTTFATTDGFGHTWLVLWLQIPSIMSQNISGTTYTPGMADSNTYMRAINTAGCAFTIAPQSSVPWVIGTTEMHFRDQSTVTNGGGVSLIAGAGVTLNAMQSRANSSAFPGAVIFVKNVTTNVWDVGGGCLVT